MLNGELELSHKEKESFRLTIDKLSREVMRLKQDQTCMDLSFCTMNKSNLFRSISPRTSLYQPNSNNHKNHCGIPISKQKKSKH
jgi:hypothetical protein